MAETPDIPREYFDPSMMVAGLAIQQNKALFSADWYTNVMAGMHQAGLIGLSLSLRSEAFNAPDYLEAGGTNSFSIKPGVLLRMGVPFAMPGVYAGDGDVESGFDYEADAHTHNYLTVGTLTAVDGGANQLIDDNKALAANLQLGFRGWRLHMTSGVEQGNRFTITSHSAGTGTFGVASVGSAAPGDTYVLIPPALTTPAGSDRFDTVYAVSMTEFLSETEYPDLEDPTFAETACYAVRNACCLVVDEGTTGVYANEAGTWWDSRLVHFTKIGTLSRTNGQATINTSDWTVFTPAKPRANSLHNAFGMNHSVDPNDDQGKHLDIQFVSTQAWITQESDSQTSINFDNEGASDVKVNIYGELDVATKVRLPTQVDLLDTAIVQPYAAGGSFSLTPRDGELHLGTETDNGTTYLWAGTTSLALAAVTEVATFDGKWVFDRAPELKGALDEGTYTGRIVYTRDGSAPHYRNYRFDPGLEPWGLVHNATTPNGAIMWHDAFGGGVGEGYGSDAAFAVFNLSGSNSAPFHARKSLTQLFNAHEDWGSTTNKYVGQMDSKADFVADVQGSGTVALMQVQKSNGNKTTLSQWDSAGVNTGAAGVIYFDPTNYDYYIEFSDSAPASDKSGSVGKVSLRIGWFVG